MATNHETVLRLSMVKLSALGAKLFRNEMGQGFVGKVEEKYSDSGGHVVTLVGARRVRYGVCNPGGSDLIGWRPVKITQGMVGQTVAQFVAVECKTREYRTMSKDQENFTRELVRSGGVAMIARPLGDGGGNGGGGGMRLWSNTEAIIAIFNRLNEGKKYTEIAIEFDCSATTIRSIELKTRKEIKLVRSLENAGVI